MLEIFSGIKLLEEMVTIIYILFSKPMIADLFLAELLHQVYPEKKLRTMKVIMIIG